MLGLAGLGGLGLLSGTGAAKKGKSGRPWNRDVNADGHALSNLGSLSMGADDAAIEGFTGGNLAVGDDGALTAEETAESIHYVTNYPGETLDEKLRTIIDHVVENYGSQAGHRIVIPPAPADEEAGIGAAWRFEEPVVLENNTGKIDFDFGGTLVFATDTIESFFIVGPDEKTEEVNFHGGYFYASGSHDDPNVTRSFFQVLGVGHQIIEDVYCQNLAPDTGGAGERDESKNVPIGIEITAEQGTSGVLVSRCSVTGCDEALRSEGVNGLTVEHFTGGGGDSSVVLDGCSKTTLQQVDVGSASIQSVKRDLIRLENDAGPNEKIRIAGVSETNGNYVVHAGVNAVDSANSGEKHRGIAVSDVSVVHADYSTDMGAALDFDQRSLTPAPAYPAPNGATRAYSEGTQTFATRNAHEFRVGGEAALTIEESDVTVAGPGNGAILTTPDGQSRYRVRVDNDGDLVTEEVQTEEDRSGVVDSFEDGDLSEYIGSTDAYEVTSDPPVADGDQSLKNTTGGTAIFGSTSGLPRYPQAGDTFSANAARTEANPNLGVAWGMQDLQNFYFARIYREGSESDANPDRLQVYRREGGDYTQLAKSATSVDTGVLYEFVVDWGETGTMDVTVRDPDGNTVATASATDTTFTEGGVGARRTGVLDDIRIL